MKALNESIFWTYRDLLVPTGTFRELQGPTETFRDLKWPTRNLQWSTGTYRDLQRPTGTYRELHGPTGNYRDLQWPSGICSDLQGTYRDLQVPRNLQQPTWIFRALQGHQGPTGTYMNLHGPTETYRYWVGKPKKLNRTPPLITWTQGKYLEALSLAQSANNFCHHMASDNYHRFYYHGSFFFCCGQTKQKLQSDLFSDFYARRPPKEESPPKIDNDRQKVQNTNIRWLNEAVPK